MTIVFLYNIICHPEYRRYKYVVFLLIYNEGRKYQVKFLGNIIFN